jgi:small subunit ribosomal protein S12e
MLPLDVSCFRLITSSEATPAAGGEQDVFSALKEVLKSALVHDGLARGLREAVKAIDKRQAHLVVLASNCNEDNYVKLIEALCAEHGIHLLKVDDNKQLGEWSGLCKIDKEGTARKIVGCSAVAITVCMHTICSR